MVSSIALKRIVSSGLLSRSSLFPVRAAAFSVSSRLFNTNAVPNYDGVDEGDCTLEAERRSRCASQSVRFPFIVPDMDTAFDPFTFRTWRPFLNLDLPMASGVRRPYAAKETADSLQLRWDMPGLGKEDVKVHMEENNLIIKGERKESEDDESERSFYTRIDLPKKLFKANAIKAEMKNGVLKVMVPKAKDEERKDVFNIGVD